MAERGAAVSSCSPVLLPLAGEADSAVVEGPVSPIDRPSLVAPMSSSLVSQNELDRVARRFRLLGEPVRLELLNALHEEGEMTVGDLVEVTGHRQANVSKHLGLLSDDGLLSRNREGKHVYYSLCDNTLPALCLLVSTRLNAERDDA